MLISNKTIIIAISLFIVFGVMNASAKIITVNCKFGEGDYSSIQSAIINAAKDGDIIMVAPCTYYENIYNPKGLQSISLIGENKDTTIIDGGGIGDVIDIGYYNWTVTGFTIQNSGNLKAGIKLSYFSSSCNIVNNIIKNNYYGIHLSQYTGFNLIYHNNFLDNTVNAKDIAYFSSSSWDNGPNDGGNYWDDHTCTGNPSDGSQPYYISGGGVDNYPFEDQDGWLLPPDSKPPTACFTVLPASGNTTTIFSVDGSCSSDPEDPTTSLKVRWDWENDGIYDTSYTTTKTSNHKYLSKGNYTIKMQVKDTGGLTDTTTLKVTVSDETPPASITELNSSAIGQTWINWTWKNPREEDFSKVMVYLDGVFMENVTTEYYNATNLTPYTTYIISAYTVDYSGNINSSSVSDTARTLPPPPDITIYTDKSSYQIGDIQKLGLNVTNPGPTLKVGINIWLEMPRDTFTLVNSSYSFPAGLNYTNPKFKTFKIPKLPLGNYIWHAVLSDPKTNEIIKEDTAEWRII